jgi:hydrogenase maturation protein HypF
MERRVLSIRGIVQGVGFRPFVFGLATKLNLGGFVRNDDGQVVIEAEGESDALNRFVAELSEHPPALAKIESVSCNPLPALGERAFRIETSRAASGGLGHSVFISPDVATCADCLRELFDKADRRYRYPFINCTNCGPRLTIVTGAPYDRARTTMASFAMCPQCQAEYDDPRDRRFHAQPTCCPHCGPRLALLDPAGQPAAGCDPIASAADALRAGRIVAIKGLGGFHLACDAGDETAVKLLRGRKHRDEKPFAIMANDLAAAGELCDIGPEEAQLLESASRPIVLLRKSREGQEKTGGHGLETFCTGHHTTLADSVAPGNGSLGVMLPYTPLHHLLMAAMDGAPLVMTSGNRSDEPIACENDEAVWRLNGIADFFLVHDRPIHVRCDDSVTRIVLGREMPIRRSRGYAPRPIGLTNPCAVPTLAVGGQLKGTFALGRERHAFVGHHLGDLDHYEAFKAFERDVALYEGLFDVQPLRIVHDLHPDYASTTYAVRRSRAKGMSLVPVQHHHAHMASCMAEHGLTQPVIGVSFDGTGYGTDGAVWGGEFLIGDCADFRRAAHLRYVRLPGGDAAVREPWRMALAYAIDAQCADETIGRYISEVERRAVGQMIARGFNSPLTSGAGRLFDAVASLAGVRDRCSYEGQAAVELEQLAAGSSFDECYPFQIARDESSKTQENVHSLIVDLRTMIRLVIEQVRGGANAAIIARRFHATVVQMIVEVCRRLRSDGGPGEVVLSGGVFMNVLLTSETASRLTSEGFAVFCHTLVPPNDGGLSLGQLAIVAARDAARTT